MSTQRVLEEDVQGFRNEVELDLITEERRVMELQLLECASKKALEDCRHQLRQVSQALSESRASGNDVAKQLRNLKVTVMDVSGGTCLPLCTFAIASAWISILILDTTAVCLLWRRWSTAIFKRSCNARRLSFVERRERRVVQPPTHRQKQASSRAAR